MILAQGPAFMPPPDWHGTPKEQTIPPDGGWIRAILDWLKKRGYLNDAGA